MPTPIKQFNSILITGGSSGIGAALAKAYARPGVRLCLSGKTAAGIVPIAAHCRQVGAEVVTAKIDVADRTAMADWVREMEAAKPLDLVIANAGVSAGTSLGFETEEQTRRIFSINVDGVLNTVLPALPFLRARKAGQIGIMSSLSAHRGWPGAPAYCASKAAIKVWGEGLRGDLAPEGVGLSVIMPGFVRSEMTKRNDFPMPHLMDAERAALIIKRGLARNKARIAFPFPTAFVAWLLGLATPGMTDALLRRLPKK